MQKKQSSQKSSSYSSSSKQFSSSSKKSSTQFVKKTTLTANPKAQYLVIVESPSKCAKIESFLGPQYQCIASRGHLCCIPGLKNIHKDNYEVDFNILYDKKDHVQQMRPIVDQFPSRHIYLACDDDREGEAIAWHIITLFSLPLNTPRIVFREITKSAIVYAIQHPRELDMPLVWSQRARQVLDIMVGFRISPMLWRFICSDRKDPLSAGRCQSVALRLVYENSKAPEVIHKGPTHRATFHVSSRLFPFVLISPLSLVSKQGCLDLLNEWRNISHWTLSPSPPKTRSVSPPQPLTTARLLQQYTHLSPHTVMELCQILYQEGHITYMRTDSTQYSAEFLEQCRGYIKSTFGKEEYFVGCAATGGTAAHEAIRVTHLTTQSVMGKDARLNSLYQYIWRTTLESCMKPARMEDHAWILHPVEAKYILEIPRDPGWMIVEKSAEHFHEKVVEATGVDLFLKMLMHVRPEKMTLEATTDRPPRHYSESALIHQLETRGIGRPSTFASIVHTLSERGYVVKGDIPGIQESKIDYSWERGGRDDIVETTRVVAVGKEHGKLILQPIGQKVAEFLQLHFQDLLSYDYTSRMETTLDNVATHETPREAYISLCRQCDDHLKDWLQPLQKMTKEKAPRLFDSTDGEEYEYKTTPKGSYLRHCITGECKPLKESIQVDLDRLQAGELNAADLLEFPGNSDVLGAIEGHVVRFSKSLYGWFLKRGEKDVIKIPAGIDLHDITLAHVVQWIEDERKGDAERSPPPPPGSLRVLNKVLSIRQGKFGPYVYNVVAKKCVSLRKFRGDFMHCSEEEIMDYYLGQQKT